MGRRLCAARQAIGRRVWERPRRPGPRRLPAAAPIKGPPARRPPLAARQPPLCARHGPQHRGRGAAQPQREEPTPQASGGEDAPRPHQQQHRAAEAAAGAGVRAPPAQLQAGEGRHPGDGGQLPKAQQSFRRCSRPQKPAPGLQRGLLLVPAGSRAVPDAALSQRHADEAALPFPAAARCTHCAHQGTQGHGHGAPARAHPRQGHRSCSAPAHLRPLAALVTRQDLWVATPRTGGPASVFLWPCVCPFSGLDRPPSPEGSLSRLAGQQEGHSQENALTESLSHRTIRAHLLPSV